MVAVIASPKRLPKRLHSGERFVSYLISGVGFFAGGIILPLVLGADVMASSGDPFAFIVMFVALTIVFL